MNSSLQGGYFILAARAVGLDCGPMGGFDAAKVNAAFFPDGKWSVNFLVNLGYGEAAQLHPRGPRLSFDEACRIVLIPAGAGAGAYTFGAGARRLVPGSSRGTRTAARWRNASIRACAPCRRSAHAGSASGARRAGIPSAPP